MKTAEEILKETKDDLQPNVCSDVFLQIECNYHTTWQSKKSMRFVLVELIGDGRAVLATRTTNKRFTTKVSDLIFIKSEYNFKKARKLRDQ